MLHPTDVTSETTIQAEWFALQTLPRHEKRVRERLQYNGVHCFLPVYSKVKRWKNGCTPRIEFPLFPTYIFVELRMRECSRMLVDPGVTRVIGTGRGPVAIPDAEIQTLRNAILAGSLQPHHYLTVGQRIRVKKGPLAGLIGILVRKNSDFRVVLTLDLIRQGASVEVAFDDVEPCA